MIKALKNLRPIKRNKAWLGSSLKAGQKASYYPAIVASYAGYVFKRNTVRFLGTTLAYDSRVTPLALMMYPEEIDLILKYTGKDLKNVLDVGGNIGQFPVTLAKIAPNAKIDSFEPNPLSFELLRTNTADFKNIRIFNLGIGKRGKHTMYYTPKRTVNASLIRQNATYRTAGQSKKVTVEIIDDVAKVTKRSKYDLVKIDVEGYEYEVVKRLKGIKAKYLYIEITGSGRQKDYSHAQLFTAIKSSFGEFDIKYVTRQSDSKFETLLQFK